VRLLFLDPLHYPFIEESFSFFGDGLGFKRSPMEREDHPGPLPPFPLLSLVFADQACAVVFSFAWQAGSGFEKSLRGVSWYPGCSPPERQLISPLFLALPASSPVESRVPFCKSRSFLLIFFGFSDSPCLPLIQQRFEERMIG